MDEPLPSEHEDRITIQGVEIALLSQPKKRGGRKAAAPLKELGDDPNTGKPIVLKNGRYDDMPIDVVVSKSKAVNVEEHYNTNRLRPYYKSFEMRPLFIMTSE